MRSSSRTFVLRIRLARRLIAAIEWTLRLLLLNRRLPEVKAWRRDLAYGDHPKQRLDVVIPPVDGPVPLFVYVHGGAWVTGDKANFAWVTHALAHAGLLVVSINYRWAPEATLRDQLGDVSKAIAWAREHAREHGGDPDRVFLAGDSAGAHLVAWLHVALCKESLLAAVGLAPPLPAPALLGSLLFYGIYDLASAWALGAAVRTPIRALLGGEPAADPALAALASPLGHVAAGIAPMLVAVGERDPLHGQSVALIEALRRAGVPCAPVVLERRRYPDAGHSFINFGGREASRRVLAEATTFVRQRCAATRSA